jgi:hypothetical protein
MIGATLMVNQLVDMEWKFGVTASNRFHYFFVFFFVKDYSNHFQINNSDMAKVGASFLQIKMTLDKGNTTTEDVHLELTLPQFYEFLAQMQKAKANLDFFS